MNKRQIGFSSQFTREFKRLQKRYHHISQDLSDLLEILKRGETPGDQVPGVGYTVYKVRVLNRDMQSGKSGGYRVIYYIRRGETLYLVTIYSKREQDNITADEIRRIVEKLEEELRSKE